MTTLVMEYTINPFWKTLSAFGRGLWSFGESIGRARAVNELSRMGYYKEAKSLMLMDGNNDW